jgi:hypothetical protein
MADRNSQISWFISILFGSLLGIVMAHLFGPGIVAMLMGIAVTAAIVGVALVRNKLRIGRWTIPKTPKTDD